MMNIVTTNIHWLVTGSKRVVENEVGKDVEKGGNGEHVCEQMDLTVEAITPTLAWEDLRAAGSVFLTDDVDEGIKAGLEFAGITIIQKTRIQILDMIGSGDFVYLYLLSGRGMGWHRIEISVQRV